MFYKPAHFKPYAAIKNSERKRVLQQISQKLQLDLSGREELLFPKATQTARLVTHGGTKCQVYASDEKVLWIVIYDQYIPSVWTLQLAPDILKTVNTPLNTLDFLKNGADFMAPGIHGDHPAFKKDDVICIRSIQGQQPIAVGLAAVDLAENAHTTGKAILLVNCIGDTLISDKDVVVRTEPEAGSPSSDATSDAKKDSTESGSAASNQETSELVSKTEKLDIDDGEQLSVEDADEAFEYALHKVLNVTHTYPMASASFAKLLNENLPYEHPDLNIKATSYKKLPKFLKHAEKSELLTLKEKKGDVIIQSAKQVGGNIPKPVKRVPKIQQEKKEARGTFKVSQFYKLNKLSDELFSEQPGGFWTAADLKAAVEKYIKEANLGSGDEVKIDEHLKHALGLKQTVEVVKRADVMPTLLKNSTHYHTIQRADDEGKPKFVKGGVPHITISTEKRGGNKVVSTVDGVEKFLDTKIVAEKLRKACAGSTTVQETRTGLRIVVQGDHCSKIATQLELLGVRPAWIKQ